MNTVNLLGDSVCIRQIAEGTITEFVDDAITVIGSYAFANCASLQSVSFPVCTTISSSAFAFCPSLQTVSFPVCTNIGQQAFYSCSSLQIVSFPVCTSVGDYVFGYCTSLQTAIFPACKQINQQAFINCTSLQTAIFPACITIINNAFCSCYHLLSLYLLGSSVPTLANKNIFSSTPISNYTASTGGVYGSIYVKSSMVNAFKTEYNWSAYSARIVATPVYSVRFLNTDDTVLQETEAYYGLDAEYTGSIPISTSAGYIFSGWNPEPKEIKQDTDCVAEYANAMNWNAIQNSIINNSYRSIYSIGNEIPLELDGIGTIHMQIVAFDKDILANETGHAHITFISKEILPSVWGHYYNSWSDSGIRNNFLENTIKNKIPNNVLSMIKKVKKKQHSENNKDTEDFLWIPSEGELFGGDSQYEKDMPVYSDIFNNDSNRIKLRNGSADIWWTRSWAIQNRFVTVKNDGSKQSTYNNNYSLGIVIGFCV